MFATGLTRVDAMSSRLFASASHSGGFPFSSEIDMSAPRVHMASTTSGSWFLMASWRAVSPSWVLQGHAHQNQKPSLQLGPKEKGHPPVRSGTYFHSLSYIFSGKWNLSTVFVPSAFLENTATRQLQDTEAAVSGLHGLCGSWSTSLAWHTAWFLAGVFDFKK